MLAVDHALKVENEGGKRQLSAPRRPRAAEPRVHPRPQDGEGKGLCDVIVRAGFQPRHLVQLQIVGGQQDDGKLRAQRLLLPQQVQPAAVRQVHVQDQQDKGRLRQRTAGLPQRAAYGDLYIRYLQRHGNALSQRDVIFQKQDPLHVHFSMQACFPHYTTGPPEYQRVFSAVRGLPSPERGSASARRILHGRAARSPSETARPLRTGRGSAGMKNRDIHVADKRGGAARPLPSYFCKFPQFPASACPANARYRNAAIWARVQGASGRSREPLP